LEILGIADRSQADPTGHERIHRRQRHRDVDPASVVVDRRRKRRREREWERERRRRQKRERLVSGERRRCHQEHGEKQKGSDVMVQAGISGLWARQ